MSIQNESSNIKSLKPSIITVILFLFGLGAAFYIGKLSTEVKYLKEGTGIGQKQELGAAPDEDPGLLAPANVQGPTAQDYIYGNKDAKFALIEYSDYECPFCQRFHETARQVVDSSNGEIMWIYRHFPLTQLHPGAEPKALAAICIGEQTGNEGFWKFTDALYGNSEVISDLNPVLNTIAGLDKTKYTECISSDEAAQRLNDDIASATSAGVTGTPGNFVMNVETGEALTLFGAVPAETINGAFDILKEQ